MLEVLTRPQGSPNHQYVFTQCLRAWKGSRVDGVVFVYSRQVAQQTASLVDEQLFVLGALRPAPVVVVMDGSIGVSDDLLDDDEAELRARLEYFGLDGNGAPIVRTSADVVLRGTEPWASEFRSVQDVMDRTFLPLEREGRDRLMVSSSVPRLGGSSTPKSRALTKSSAGRPVVHAFVLQGELRINDEVDLVVSNQVHRMRARKLEDAQRHPAERIERGHWAAVELAGATPRTTAGVSVALVHPRSLRSSRSLTVSVSHMWQQGRGITVPDFQRGQTLLVTTSPGCLPPHLCRVVLVDRRANDIVLMLESQHAILTDRFDLSGPVILRGGGTAVAQVIESL
ncbi:MAG: hypothetical protein U0165_19080 [Polyangiaceae bacterium]